jgi:hypothetical protein
MARLILINLIARKLFVRNYITPVVQQRGQALAERASHTTT